MRIRLILIAALAGMNGTALADSVEPAVASARPAFDASIVTACGQRGHDWAEKIVQAAAADSFYDAPTEGTGFFAYSSPAFIDLSVGQVAMAAYAGPILYARYGDIACRSFISKQILDQLDRKAARTAGDAKNVLIKPETVPSDILKNAILIETAEIAVRCKIRTPAWGHDAKEAINVRYLGQSSGEEGSQRIRYGEGATVMAGDIASREVSALRVDACRWAKDAPQVRDLDQSVDRLRQVTARTKRGDWSGFGGIK